MEVLGTEIGAQEEAPLEPADREEGRAAHHRRPGVEAEQRGAGEAGPRAQRAVGHHRAGRGDPPGLPNDDPDQQWAGDPSIVAVDGGQSRSNI